MLNKCMIIGRLGADPEMRYTANGNAVTNFNVATSRNYTNSQGERVEVTNSDLKAGDQVVLLGNETLRPGQVVRPKSATPHVAADGD